jgi:hypothetical protein
LVPVGEIVTMPVLINRCREAEADTRQLREQLRRAIERAELAERSARDAWAFAQGLIRTPRR